MIIIIKSIDNNRNVNRNSMNHHFEIQDSSSAQMIIQCYTNKDFQSPEGTCFYLDLLFTPLNNFTS